jgi:HlyD family secretion protein
MEKNKHSLFKRIIKKKRTWIILGIILIVAGYFIFRSTDNSKNIVSDFAKYIDLKQTVLATGQVTSETDLNLSFNANGIVKSIKVQVGDKVKTGQIIATLDQGAILAGLTSARGALAAANARLQKTLDGASNEEISLAKIALASAKSDYENIKNTQDTLVDNAYNNLLNSAPEAVPSSGTNDYTAPTISGNYNLNKEGTIVLTISYAGSSAHFSVSGLVTGEGIVTATTAQPIGNSGLYIKFPSTSNISFTDWVITIPNIKAANYLTNYNAYQSALKNRESSLSSAQSLIDQRTAELALKQAAARKSDIDLARADIISAQGQLESAQARYDDTIIRAPADGTITKIDIKIGELAQALKEAIVLQDISNIYLEANINEANIASLNIGMPIDVTYDAFGSDKIFKGTITKIDPSSTLVSGVVNYKVTASVEQVIGIKPGMTANMTIKANEKNHVLVVPSRAILTDKNGNKTIRLVTNTKTKEWTEAPIITGMEGDSGMIEVVSGLKDGDEYVVLIKTS